MALPFHRRAFALCRLALELKQDFRPVSSHLETFSKLNSGRKNLPLFNSGTTRLVSWIIGGSPVYIRLILLTQNSHSLQRFHRDVSSPHSRSGVALAKIRRTRRSVSHHWHSAIKKEPIKGSLLMAGTTHQGSNFLIDI